MHAVISNSVNLSYFPVFFNSLHAKPPPRFLIPYISRCTSGEFKDTMAEVAEPKIAEEVAPEKENVEPVAIVAEEPEQKAEASPDADADADADEADAEKEKNGSEGGGDEEELTKLERNIIRQVEYYFGDANLNRDKFLLEQISKDEGWVPFTVLLTFKRLASYTTDAEVIVDALLKSSAGLLEISEDRQKVRRNPDIPTPEQNEERRKEIMSRTAYAKGFPLDTDMSELLDYFAPYEKVSNINMRKYLDKPTKTHKFKGSVFVTFEKKEQTQEFIEKEKVVYKERELIRKWQDKYLEDKKEEMKAKSKKSKGKPVEEDKIELPKGTVLFFEGATEVVTRELLREAVEKVDGNWEIAYVDFSKGDKDGHIRFEEENIAAKFLEKLKEKKLKLKDDIELTLRTLSEEEEKAFLEKAVEQMKNRRSQQNKRKGGGHGGHGHGHGGHGHGHNRKRRGGNDNRNDDKKRKADGE